MSTFNKTKQRKRKARRNRAQEAIEARMNRATGTTTTSIKAAHPDYAGATDVDAAIYPDQRAFMAWKEKKGDQS